MWQPLDLVFKKFLGKRVTHDGKKFYEEFGDKAFDINADDVKTSPVPFDDPAQAVIDNVAELRTLLTLTEDTSTPNNQSWYAFDVSRLKDWLGDKYGAQFTVKVFDNNDSEIFQTDPSDWIFDYVTGILLFSGDVSSYARPFKVTGYRYTGAFLSGGALGGGSKHDILLNGAAQADRAALDFTGAVAIVDDAGNDKLIITIAADAADVSYAPTTPENWGFASVIPSDVKVGLDELASILNATLPAKADSISNLSLSGTTLYSGILPSGLAVSWYTFAAAGDVINDLVYDNSFILSFTDFRSGKADATATYGQLSAIIDGITGDIHDMTTGVGVTGIVEVTGINPFNTIWAASDGQLNILQSTEGVKQYQMEHTEAGTSTPEVIYYDDNVVVPTFSAIPVVAVVLAVDKWLSGVSYFGFGTEFSITYTVDNAFQKVYSQVGVTRVEIDGMTTVEFDPSVIPAFNDQLVVTTESIFLDAANQANVLADATVIVTKPNNNNVASAVYDIAGGLSKGISTYSVISTTTSEFFQDEDKRLNAGTNTAFDSTIALAITEALVTPGQLNQNGGVDEKYERLFFKTTANSGTITFAGIAYTDIAAYATGNVNVLLLLETEVIYFDLGKAFGDNNGTGSGDSPANSKGARVAGSGSDIDFSFGTFSTANNSNEYRMIITLKNASAGTITTITTV